MSFIQCQNKEDLEKALEGKPAAFCTEDHRIYEQVLLADDQAYLTLDAKTALALFDLQTQMEMVSSPLHESNFEDIVKDAVDLRDTFRRAMAAIKFKPLERVRRK